MSPERRKMREAAAQMPPTVDLEGVIFEIVDAQRDGKSAIYKGEDSYLRIGDPMKIEKDLALHKKMELLGFPVAKLISEGKTGDRSYFIESSLGDEHLGNLFAQDTKSTGEISQENFQSFLSVAAQFARAQLRTVSTNRDYAGFATGIHLDVLKEELPYYEELLNTKFREVEDRTKDLPFVLSHGDFNPNNLYPSGAIDFEDSFHAPFGHDLIGGLMHIDYFPDSTDYEYFAKYRFSDENRAQYLKLLDSICNDAGIPPLSGFQEDFEFTRAVWLLVRLHHVPKFQKFRYDKFINKFLK